MGDEFIVIVGWTSHFQMGYWNGIYARRFTNDGHSLSDELSLNEGGWMDEMNLTGLGVAPDGTFVATWTANVSPLETGVSFFFRLAEKMN